MVSTDTAKSTIESHSSAFNPFHQFKIKTIFSFDFFGIHINFTNSALCMAISVLLITALFFLNRNKYKNHVPNRIMAIFEMLFGMIHNMARSYMGNKPPYVLVNLIFSTFLFIILLNSIGLMPFGFTSTSHISVTMFVAMVIFIIMVGISVGKHGLGFFKVFVPKGTPIWMAPIMFILEFFSYIARPISLSVRLAANMIAGHVMLDVMAYFCLTIGLLSFVPFLFLIVLGMFEVFVAILQAYIFTLLSCVYIGESIHH